MTMATHIQAGAMVNGLMGVVGIQNAEEKADQEALNELDNFAADPELMRRRVRAQTYRAANHAVA